MLEVLGVKKKYKNGIEALKGVSLKIEIGEKVAIFGENGAGKTTLLKIIATFLLPDEGTVTLEGVNIIKNNKCARKNITISTGMERSFYYRLTVKQNLEFFGMLNGFVGKELKKKIEKVIEETGLEEYRRIRYMELSKGLKRRLDIARALLKEAKVYIFDEACAGVDIKTRGRIHEIMNELARKERIVIFATHEIDDLKKMDRIIAIHSGIKAVELLVHENSDGVENFVKGIC